MTSPGWLDGERGALALERILDAAASLFAEQGVAGVGVGDIARAAGCSRATFYRYFESRDALRSAFVNRQAERIGRQVADRIAALPDPAQRLTEAVMASLGEVRADPTLSAWFSEADAGIAVELAASSEIVERLASTMVGESDDPELGDRSRWLVRCIVSLLAMPGRDEADERAMVQRFVVPAVLAPG